MQVVLPGDRKVEEIYTKDKPPSLEDQLADVQAHIEDLHVRTFFGLHFCTKYGKKKLFKKNYYLLRWLLIE